jgi:serine/threonine protein kinase
MDAIPETIGRYRIESVLGRGAMGVIFRAHDPDIDRPVAIKLIRADLLGGEDRADYIQRFRREAQAAGRCMHPNIVAIYDFAMHEGNPFLAMEFVDGISLDRARVVGGLAPADAVFIILQVLDALGAAHAMGITHRDIKPANILLVGGSLVKVTDFGISRFDNSELTSDGSVIGTPSYMSPEQCRGSAVDGRGDLFSTGVVLYELLGGERPFTGRSSVEVMQRVLTEEPRALPTRKPEVTPALSAVVARALAKAPDDRYQNAADMAAALRAAMADDPAVATLSDRTVVLARGPAADAVSVGHDASGSSWSSLIDVGTRMALERRLAEHVGPIARVLVQSAVRGSRTIEVLCDRLAANVTEPLARSRFRAEILDRLQRGPGATTSATAIAPVALPPAELERAQRELLRYLGPIARVLVKRAAIETHSVPELWQKLSVHIEREEDRRAFLRRESG